MRHGVYNTRPCFCSIRPYSGMKTELAVGDQGVNFDTDLLRDMIKTDQGINARVRLLEVGFEMPTVESVVVDHVAEFERQAKESRI